MAAQYHTDFGMLFAGLVLVTLPILIVYVLSPAAHRPRRHRWGTEGVNVFTSAGACVLFIPPTNLVSGVQSHHGQRDTGL